MNDFDWPLNEINHSLLDRLKICAFFLNPKNQWSQGEKVRKLETAFEEYTGAKYGVFVSSGSAANTLMARRIKHLQEQNPYDIANIVVTNVVSWHTSLSPWKFLGYEIKLIDVSLKDFIMDYDLLEKYLEENQGKVKVVFLVNLLGIAANIPKYQKLCDRYNVTLLLDNCECAMSYQVDEHICKNVTSSVSTYVGHHLNSGEGGCILTNSEEEFIFYLMGRSHGMVRALEPYKDKLTIDINSLRNPLVDSRFDFNILGDNLRNTDINAYLGLLDIKRAKQYEKKRRSLWNDIRGNLNQDRYIIPYSQNFNVPFCFPIVLKEPDYNKIDNIKKELASRLIEWRSIVGGNLARQTCFQGIEDYHNFPNAEFLNSFGIYVGLYPKLNRNKLLKLIDFLNRI